MFVYLRGISLPLPSSGVMQALVEVPEIRVLSVRLYRGFSEKYPPISSYLFPGFLRWLLPGPPLLS